MKFLQRVTISREINPKFINSLNNPKIKEVIMNSFLSRILIMTGMFMSISLCLITNAAKTPLPNAAKASGMATTDIANIPEIYIRLILVDRNYKPLEAQTSYRHGDLEIWKDWQLRGYFNDVEIGVFRFDDYNSKKLSEKYQFKVNEYCLDGSTEPNKNHKVLHIAIDIMYLEGAKHVVHYSLFERDFKDLGNSCDINGHIEGVVGLPDRESTAKLVYTGEKLNGIVVYDLLLPPMWSEGAEERYTGRGGKVICNDEECSIVKAYLRL